MIVSRQKIESKEGIISELGLSFRPGAVQRKRVKNFLTFQEVLIHLVLTEHKQYAIVL